MKNLAEIVRHSGGVPIANLAELQTYSYGISEEGSSPPLVTRMIAGEDVDPRELYAALDGPARSAVFPDDAGLEVIETILGRLRTAFPGLTGE